MEGRGKAMRDMAVDRGAGRFDLEGRLRRYRRVAGVSRDFDVYSRLAEPSGDVLSSTAG
jgi:hypothetical protein